MAKVKARRGKAKAKRREVKGKVEVCRLAPTPELPPGTYSLYDIMQRTGEIVREEPARLNMSDWVRSYKDETVAKQATPPTQPPCWVTHKTAAERAGCTKCYDFVEAYNAWRDAGAPPAPACSTVACWAGWGGVLLGRRITSGQEFLSLFTLTKALDEAEAILDPAGEKRVEALDKLDTLFGEVSSSFDVGTPEYADEVADQFEEFAEDHAGLLKQLVTVVPGRRAKGRRRTT
jgi:hypothetical protein